MAVADGDGVWFGSYATGFSGNVTAYMGHFAGAIRTTPDKWWSTSQVLTYCTGTVSLSTAPGTSKTWTISMDYNENNTTDAETCGTDLAPYVNSGTLCTISGTDKNCSFATDLTLLNGGVGIAADSCFQLQIDGSGTPAGTADMIWEVHCSAATDSVSGMSGFSTMQDNRTFYCGTGKNSPNNCSVTAGAVTHFVNWDSNALQDCAGWFGVEPAPAATPNASKLWTVDVQVSTSAVTAGQTCADLSYNTISGCVVSSNEHSCSTGGFIGCGVPGSGGCYRFRLTPTGSPKTTTYEKFNLDVRNDGSSGGAFAVSRTSSWGSGTSSPRYLADHASAVSTEPTAFSIVPYDLTACDGGFMQTTAVTAGNHADLEMEYSNAALTSGQKCSNLSYTSTGTLCSISASNKSCTFNAASVPAVEGGCMRLKYVPSGSFGAGDSVWGWHCN